MPELWLQPNTYQICLTLGVANYGKVWLATKHTRSVFVVSWTSWLAVGWHGIRGVMAITVEVDYPPRPCNLYLSYLIKMKETEKP